MDTNRLLPLGKPVRFDKTRFFILQSVLLLSLATLKPSAFAATHYVRTGANGSGSGADWTNAYPNVPSSLVRGDTYYVAAGSYGNLTLKDSGTNMITILHPTASSHGTDTGWNAAYAGEAIWTGIEINASDYTIDGVTGGGPGSWSNGFGFAVYMPASGGQAHAIGVTTANVSNITIRHMDIKGRGRSYTGGDTDLIYMLSSYNNFNIGYSYLHDTDRTMMLTWPSAGTGMTIEYSYLARNGVAEHREAWSLSSDSNVIVRYNLFEDIFGTGVLAAVNNAGTAANWQVYGNAMYWTGNYTDGIINTGVIVIAHGNCPTSQCVVTSNWLIYNNIITGLVAGSFISGFDFESVSGPVVCQNNIWYNNNASSGPGPSGCGDATTADYNWFYKNTPTNNTRGSHDMVGTSNPFVGGSSGSFPFGNWEPAIQIAGLSLPAPYNVDALGAGPDGGIWNRGAYQGSNSTSAGPAAPQGLTATVQ
jgi:hypothetical protein